MKVLLLLFVLTTGQYVLAKNQCVVFFVKTDSFSDYLDIGTIIKDTERLDKKAQKFIDYEKFQFINFATRDSFTTENSPTTYLENIKNHNEGISYHENFPYRFNFILSNLKSYRSALRLMQNNITGARSQKVIDEFVSFYNDVDQTYKKYQLFDYIYEDVPTH